MLKTILAKEKGNKMIQILLMMKRKRLSDWDFLLRELAHQFSYHTGDIGLRVHAPELEVVIDNEQPKVLVTLPKEKTEWLQEEDGFVLDDLVARSVVQAYIVKGVKCTQQGRVISEEEPLSDKNESR